MKREQENRRGNEEKTPTQRAIDLVEQPGFESARSSAPVFSSLKDVEESIRVARNDFEQDEIVFNGEATEMTELQARYRRGAVFAEGGQGILCKAEDDVLKRLVAVKMLRPELNCDEQARAQFIQEAKVTAQLDHPGVIPIYSLNTDEEKRLFLAMKLIDGKTLKDYLHEIVLHYRVNGIKSYDERKSLRFRLNIFLDVCDAIEYAHSRNVMHCDLKPENIIVGRFHETYVMDWGIARLIKEPGVDPSAWTPPKTISGTPRFLSPEAVRGERTDQRADIYTLGLILFELVALREAYSGRSTADVVAKIRAGETAPLKHRFRAKIDSTLKAIVRKAIATDRDKRYQNVRELSDDLRKFLSGFETTAKRDNPLEKAIRFLVHHRRISLLLLTACLFFSVSAAGYTLIRYVSRNKRTILREQLIQKHLSRSMETANLLDANLAWHGNQLIALADKLLFVFRAYSGTGSDDASSLRSVYDMRPDSGNAPDTLLYSPVYQEPVDFARFAYKPAGKEATSGERAILNAMDPLRMLFLKAFLEAVPPEAAAKNPISFLREDGIPLNRILIGFENGLFVSYPGSDFDDSYSPLQRPWFLAAKRAKNGNVCWVGPYLNSNAKLGYLLACSIRLIDADGADYGVAAESLLLSTVMELVRNSGNVGPNVIEKSLVDAEGNILLSTLPSVAEAQRKHAQRVAADPKTSALLTIPYPQPAILDAARRNKFGSMTREENGHLYLYCFNFIAGQGWNYIEKIEIPR